MASTPTPKNVRLTISVTPEVHATFQRLAKGTNQSISRSMGEWLADTVEAAQFMATKVEQARAAPGLVMREMHAYALGMVDETSAMIEGVKNKGREARAVGTAAGGPLARVARPHIPPSSNTGGKGQGQSRSKGGKVL